VGGRSNILREQKWTIIDDCYNANPVSMKAALDLLDTADTRKVAILGDMGELGENESTLHREIGEYAILTKVDLLVCVGALSQAMYEGASDQSGKEAQGKSSILYYATRDGQISRFDRVCQFRVNDKMPEIIFEEVEMLGNKDRDGFGSTGEK
jgi:UDP-N-acetylmuramoyl-tripeptide--D-alanyl-D-alanine ligase